MWWALARFSALLGLLEPLLWLILLPGSVQAAWQPLSAQVGLTLYTLGSVTENQQTQMLPVHSSHPDCPAPEVTITWQDHALSPELRDSALQWSSPLKTAQFAVHSDCTSPAVLLARTSEPGKLPWGVAASSGSHLDSTNHTHVIFLQDTPVAVQWFSPSFQTVFHLELARPEAAERQPDPITPLLGQWWQGGEVMPCQTLVTLFFPETACASQPVWWQKHNAPTRQSSEPVPLPQPGEVIISEVNWAGSFRDGVSQSADEWIEITNVSAESLSLHGVHLVGGGAGGQTLTLNQPIELAPYGVVVIARQPDANSQRAQPADLVLPGLSLSNTEAELVLQLPDGSELDRTPSGAWKVGSNQLSPVPWRASAQRILQTVGAGGAWSSWRSCSTSQEPWCGDLSVRSHHSSTTTTSATPGMLSPW